MEKYNLIQSGLAKQNDKPILIKIIKERPKEYQFSKYKLGWLLILRQDYGEYVVATSLKVNEPQNWDNGLDTTIAVKKGDYVVCDNRLYLDKNLNLLNDE